MHAHAFDAVAPDLAVDLHAGAVIHDTWFAKIFCFSHAVSPVAAKNVEGV
jgi:hypothetical protein